MYDESFLKRQMDYWSYEYYPSLCFGVHNDIENKKKTTMEEDEDE